MHNSSFHLIGIHLFLAISNVRMVKWKGLIGLLRCIYICRLCHHVAVSCGPASHQPLHPKSHTQFIQDLFHLIFQALHTSARNHYPGYYQLRAGDYGGARARCTESYEYQNSAGFLFPQQKSNSFLLSVSHR